MALAEGGRRHQKPIHLNRREFLRDAAIVGGFVAAGAVGGAIDRFVLNKADESENSAIANFQHISEGQIVPAIPASAIEGTTSEFTGDVQGRLIYTQDALKEALSNVKNPNTHKPIEYAFNPQTEIVVLAALAYRERPELTRVHLSDATEKDGVMNIDVIIENQSELTLSEEGVPTVINGPYALKRFPRVQKDNREIRYQARPKFTTTPSNLPPFIR